MVACPRCHGLLYQDYDFPRCINCGNRLIPPFVETMPAHLKCLDCHQPPEEGFVRCRVHRLTIRDHHRGVVGICMECGQEPRLANKTIGSQCLSARIKRGFAASRSTG